MKLTPVRKTIAEFTIPEVHRDMEYIEYIELEQQYAPGKFHTLALICLDCSLNHYPFSEQFRLVISGHNDKDNPQSSEPDSQDTGRP